MGKAIQLVGGRGGGHYKYERWAEKGGGAF